MNRKDLVTKSLSSLCSLIVDCPHSTPRWTNSGKIVVRNNNIKNGKIDLSNPSFTDEEHFSQRIKRATPQYPDIIITREAPMGEVGMVPEKIECCLGQRMVLLRPDSSLIDPHYLLYILQTQYVQHQISWSEGTGTTVSNLRIPHLKDLQIPMVEMDMQRKMVSTIKVIDEKSDLNRSINESLLMQAKSVFDKYYRAANDKQKFTTLINIMGGGTPKTSNHDFWNGDIPFFTPKDVGAPYTFQTEKSITESGLANCNSRLYPSNTTFVTARGTVGKVGIAGNPMAMNQSCYALVSDTIDPILVYFYAHKVVDSLKHKASGAVFDAIVTRDFEVESINILNKDVSDEVLSIVTPMMEAIHNNAKENLLLSTLKDTLLPKLMSGELDVMS